VSEDALGPQETRVLALERKQERLDDALANFSRQLVQLEQDIWQTWSELGGPAPICTANFSGNLVGCTGAGLVGYVISVMDATTSVTLGHVTTTTFGAFSGSVTIRSPMQSVHLTTTGIPNYLDSVSAFTLFCGSNTLGSIAPTPIVNHAPTINSISTQSFCQVPGTTYNVALSGISDGDGGTQVVTISATSSNTSIIPNPTITYTNPNATGTLVMKGTAPGTVTISVKVHDNGGTSCSGSDTTIKTFSATYSEQATPPAFDPIANQTGHITGSVTITGIAASPDYPTATLTFSSSPGPFDSPLAVTISYSGGTTATLSWSTLATGTFTVAVTLTSSLPAVVGCGTNHLTRTFQITAT